VGPPYSRFTARANSLTSRRRDREHLPPPPTPRRPHAPHRVRDTDPPHAMPRVSFAGAYESVLSCLSLRLEPPAASSSHWPGFRSPARTGRAPVSCGATRRGGVAVPWGRVASTRTRRHTVVTLCAGDHEKSPGSRSTRGYVVRREGIELPTRWESCDRPFADTCLGAGQQWCAALVIMSR
jgi:hypothetical protein